MRVQGRPELALNVASLSLRHSSCWIRLRLILVLVKLACFKIEWTPIVSYNVLIGEAVGRSLWAADSVGFYRMVRCAVCSH
jgi:hypothetical protein